MYNEESKRVFDGEEALRETPERSRNQVKTMTEELSCSTFCHSTSTYIVRSPNHRILRLFPRIPVDYHILDRNPCPGVFPYDPIVPIPSAVPPSDYLYFSLLPKGNILGT